MRVSRKESSNKNAHKKDCDCNAILALLFCHKSRSRTPGTSQLRYRDSPHLIAIETGAAAPDAVGKLKMNEWKHCRWYGCSRWDCRQFRLPLFDGDLFCSGKHGVQDSLTNRLIMPSWGSYSDAGGSGSGGGNRQTTSSKRSRKTKKKKITRMKRGLWRNERRPPFDSGGPSEIELQFFFSNVPSIVFHSRWTKLLAVIDYFHYSQSLNCELQINAVCPRIAIVITTYAGDRWRQYRPDANIVVNEQHIR